MKRRLYAVIALLLVAVTILGTLVALRGLADLGVQDSAISLLAVATSAFVAIRSLDTQRRLERERQLGERRDKLVESYRGVYGEALKGRVPTEDVMRRFNVDLTFYGNEGVIKAWLGMRQAAAGGKTDPATILPAQMRLVRAMRKDLGHQDKNLTDEDLFSIVLSNPDELKRLLTKTSGQAS